ncbi:MAG: hypothetical protein ACK4L7_02760 [Flavobacteriales bacterium]
MKKLPFVAALSLLAACAPSTKVVQSWREPSVTITEGAYNKVLVIGLIKDEATRRSAEDRMAALMKGHGVASYSYLGPDPEVINEPAMNQRMRNDGIDGVLIMRLLDRSREQTIVPGSVYPTYYYNPWSMYGYSYGFYSTPGYVRVDDRYVVETNLYSTKREGLIWSSTTSTLNPANLDDMVSEVMQVVYQRMKQDGFVVGPAAGK